MNLLPAIPEEPLTPETLAGIFPMDRLQGILEGSKAPNVRENSRPRSRPGDILGFNTNIGQSSFTFGPAWISTPQAASSVLLIQTSLTPLLD